MQTPPTYIRTVPASVTGLAFVILLFSGCMRSGPHDGTAGPEHPGSMRYARQFDVEDHGGFRLVEVFDPWQNSKGVSFRYILPEGGNRVPDSLAHLPVIPAPVNRVVVMATSHAAMICRLGMAHTIVGMSGNRFTFNEILRERIEQGLVREVGYEQGINYEAVVSLKPDVLFLYGVEGSVRAQAGKLRELGVPVVFCAEYLENHPLGKAEWIRFFSYFLDREETALDFFNSIDSAYSSYVRLTDGVEDRPRILSGLPWKDTWYVPGGQSFAAQLIQDAGGEYLWQDDPSNEALALDLESVFSKALQADIWINPGTAASLDELHRFDPRFAELPVLDTGSVYTNTARMNESGGNDYWESGSIRPDLILADLIELFHPGLLADHQLIYYRKLK